jgi:hypothetical protein
MVLLCGKGHVCSYGATAFVWSNLCPLLASVSTCSTPSILVWALTLWSLVVFVWICSIWAINSRFCFVLFWWLFMHRGVIDLGVVVDVGHWDSMWMYGLVHHDMWWWGAGGCSIWPSILLVEHFVVPIIFRRFLSVWWGYSCHISFWHISNVCWLIIWVVWMIRLCSSIIVVFFLKCYVMLFI